MSFKVVFFLAVSYGKYSSSKRLKKEYFLRFVPVPGINVKIDKKTHLIEDVVYDLDADIFNVFLEEDDSLRYTYRVFNLDKIVDFYIESGWEEFTPTNYENVITSLEMHDVITAINDIKDELEQDAFIEMVSAVMVESKLTRSLELIELFYFCNLNTCQSIAIMKRINELQVIQRDKNGN